MKIRKENDKIIIELDCWQEGHNTYGDGKWKVSNLVGVITGDEMTINQAIYLDYKNDLQEGLPFIHFDGDREGFLKLCTELGLNVWEHDVCPKCGEVIYGCSYNNLCFTCNNEKNHNKKR